MSTEVTRFRRDPRRVERPARDALDLVARVAHRVVRRAAVCRDAARLPVIQTPGQLADDEHVGAGEDLRLERTGRLEAGPDLRRPQVRIELELAADRQERRLRAAARNRRDRTRDRRRRRAGWRPRSRAAASVVVGQRRQAAPQRRAADGRFAEVELMPEARGRPLGGSTPRRRRLRDRCRRPGAGEWMLSSRDSGFGIRDSRIQCIRISGLGSGIRSYTPCP